MSNRLDEIKERLAKITPGPWEAASAASGNGGKWTLTEWFVRQPEDDVSIAAEIIDPKTGEPSKANAAFIAAAPQDIAALVAYAEKLREGLEYVKNDNENPLGFATDSQVAEHFLELADAALTESA